MRKRCTWCIVAIYSPKEIGESNDILLDLATWPDMLFLANRLQLDLFVSQFLRTSLLESELVVEQTTRSKGGLNELEDDGSSGLADAPNSKSSSLLTSRGTPLFRPSTINKFLAFVSKLTPTSFSSSSLSSVSVHCGKSRTI